METIEYRGYSIEIHRDEYPANPFEEWDCEPPMVVLYGRYEKSEYWLELTAPTLTEEQIKGSLPAIKGALGITGGLLAFCTDYAYSYRGNYANATDLFNDAIGEYVTQQSDCDKMETLADLYNAIGVPALCTSVQGYSQGDYAELLIVCTPEYQKRIGTKLTLESLRATADLYAAWAYGDVYGYQVPSIDESCWGFYGPDHKDSGLLEYAQNAIDCHIERTRRARIEQIKVWIKNRVPLQYRRVAVC